MTEQTVPSQATSDPRAWKQAILGAAPDTFMPRRFADPTAPRLLSFGGGPHFCLGAALARVTLEESVRGTAVLAPALTAPADEIEWVQRLGCSPAHLPVSV